MADFADSNHSIYADKTEIIHRPVEHHERVYLSRPHCFGESPVLGTPAPLLP
ncbi:MAG: hypothetical protein IJ228_03010 [Succinivibrio sp.]|nr:hypothetical protein [Succinivibrio sp.]